MYYCVVDPIFFRCIKNLIILLTFLYCLSFCSTFLLILFQHQHGHKVNHIDVFRYRVVYGIIFQNMINLNSSMCMGIKYKVQLTMTLRTISISSQVIHLKKFGPSQHSHFFIKSPNFEKKVEKISPHLNFDLNLVVVFKLLKQILKTSHHLMQNPSLMLANDITSKN